MGARPGDDHANWRESDGCRQIPAISHARVSTLAVERDLLFQIDLRPSCSIQSCRLDDDDRLPPLPGDLPRQALLPAQPAPTSMDRQGVSRGRPCV